jgi:hypothetical protein
VCSTRIILLLQPANSPDTNASDSDAAFYRSLEYVLGEQKPIELIKEVRAA